MITPLKGRLQYLKGKMNIWFRTFKPKIGRSLERARNIQKPFTQSFMTWGKQILLITILVSIILYFLDILYVNALDTQSFSGILSLNLFTEVIGAFLTTILITMLQRYYVRMSNDAQKLKEAVMRLRMDLYDWEFDLLTDAEKNENQLLRALKKWLWRQDETGWLEINALVESDGKIVAPKCRLMIERELWRMKNHVVHPNPDQKEKLEALILYNEPSKSIDELLQEFDRGVEVENQIFEAMVKNSFIRWAWIEDETGWFELISHAPEKSNYLSSIIEMIELELGYLDEQRHQGRRVDPKKEKRLKDIYIRAMM